MIQRIPTPESHVFKAGDRIRIVVNFTFPKFSSQVGSILGVSKIDEPEWPTYDITLDAYPGWSYSFLERDLTPYPNVPAKEKP